MLSVVAIATPVFAQEPSAEEIEQYIELAGIDGSFQSSKNICIDNLKKNVFTEDRLWTSPITEGIPKHSIYGSKVRQAYDEWLREYCDADSKSAFRNSVRATIRKQITSEELQKSIEYLSSDAGKKIDFLVSNLSANWINSWGQNSPQRLQTSLQHFDERMRGIRDEYQAASK